MNGTCIALMLRGVKHVVLSLLVERKHERFNINLLSIKNYPCSRRRSFRNLIRVSRKHETLLRFDSPILDNGADLFAP